METNALDQQLAHRLEPAELGDYAWQSAPECPQGHANRDVHGDEEA